jgi:hypothetical protein
MGASEVSDSEAVGKFFSGDVPPWDIVPVDGMGEVIKSKDI